MLGAVLLACFPGIANSTLFETSAPSSGGGCALHSAEKQ